LGRKTDTRATCQGNTDRSIGEPSLVKKGQQRPAHSRHTPPHAPHQRDGARAPPRRSPHRAACARVRAVLPAGRGVAAVGAERAQGRGGAVQCHTPTQQLLPHERGRCVSPDAPKHRKGSQDLAQQQPCLLTLGSHRCRPAPAVRQPLAAAARPPRRAAPASWERALPPGWLAWAGTHACWRARRRVRGSIPRPRQWRGRQALPRRATWWARKDGEAGGARLASHRQLLGARRQRLVVRRAPRAGEHDIRHHRLGRHTTHRHLAMGRAPPPTWPPWNGPHGPATPPPPPPLCAHHPPRAGWDGQCGSYKLQNTDAVRFPTLPLPLPMPRDAPATQHTAARTRPRRR